ncbi:MAG: synthase, delta subunit [Acidobacteria bacterium]|nr:synthase, delta subunit [Acidobacteriota bacterium]
MSLQTIARRYAIALADVAVENGEAVAVQEELSVWGQMISSNALLKEALSNPTVPYDQKRKLLEELIKRTRVRPTTANFLQVLLRNQRLSEINEVNKWFSQILDERSGVIAAEVTTARPVSEKSVEALRTRLTAISGKQVRLSFITDEDLIGGMVARIGSTVYDGSIRNQLREMELKLSGS